MLRVNNGVLVVPPFECAWLTGDGYTLRSGSGCLSFEAKGDTDVTVILKSTPGAKRLQPLLRQTPGTSGSASTGNALQVEQNYTIIFGSHRNSCLKIEKNGVTQCMVTGVACSRVSNKLFSKYWIDLNHGVLTVGHGEAGQDVCYQWRDTQEIPGIQHIGLSCWDRHVSYRSIALQPPLDFTRLQRAQAGSGGAAAAVPSLFDTTCAAIITATTPTNVCRTLHVAELLLPTTQKLYRYCLDYIARHLETVVGLPDPSQHLRCVSPAAMCDLVCQNTFSVDEQGIFAAVHDWACSYVAEAAAGDAKAGTEAEAGGASAEAGATGGRREGRAGGGEGASERHCVVRRAESPPGGSPGAPSSPAATAMPRPRLSDPSAPPTALPVAAAPPAVGSGGARGSRTSSHTDLTLALDLVSLSSAPSTPVRLSPPPAGGPSQAPMRASADGVVAAAAAAAAVGISNGGGSGGIHATNGRGSFAAEEVVCRVLSLIRFPLLPIAQLHACLREPLLRRLPAVLELVHEALEVHRRETGAELSAAGQGGRSTAGSGAAHTHVPGHPHTHAGSGVGSDGALGLAAAAGGGTTAASVLSPVSGRRLVKPVPATASGAGSSTAAAGASAAGTTGALDAVVPGSGGSTSATTATGGGATGSESCWSVRYQRRCLPFALELMYVCDGDSCGVLHFLGTSYGEQGWVNPMLAKRVDVRASSPTGRTTDPRGVVGRQFVRTNFAGPRYVNGTALSWWQVDLGEQHQLAITYYTLRHDGSQDFVRSWVLQGSNDLSTWVDLKRHAHDTTIKVPGQYASWPVIGPAAAVPYRAFRVLLTGPNASPNTASRHNLCLSNLELYGFLHKGVAASTGGGGDGTGVSSAAASGGASSGNGAQMDVAAATVCPSVSSVSGADSSAVAAGKLALSDGTPSGLDDPCVAGASGRSMHAGLAGAPALGASGA